MTLTMARAATNPSSTVHASCTTSVGVNTDQDVSFKASGPDSIEAGAAGTLTLDPVEVTFPSSASGQTINSYQDIQTKVDITGANVTGAVASGGSNLGAGGASAAPSGNSVILTIPGPIAGGSTVTTPTVTISITVTAAAGGTTGLKPGTPFYKLTANTASFGAVATTCNPSDASEAAKGTLTVPVSGPDTTPPSITITAPYESAIYGYQQAVKAAYNCSDPAGVASCAGPVANGGAIDTATQGPKTFTVNATDSRGNTTSRTINYIVLAPGVEPPPPPTYTPLNPGRLLDTRAGGSTVDGVAVGGGTTANGQTIELQVAGRHGVPDDALAAVLNITATGTKGWGYLTVYPCGEPRPNASSLNYTQDGDTRPNAVVTKLGAGGKVCLYTAQAGADLLADVDGFFPPGAAYAPLNPGRLLDTRTGGSTVDSQNVGGGATTSGQTIELPVAGRYGIDADAEAVVLNVTATETAGWGYVTVWPCGDNKPVASNLNYTAAGETSPNAVITKVGANGKVCLFTDLAGAQLLVDAEGFFPAGSGYTPLNPGRLLDTRTGTSTVDGGGAGIGAPPVGQTIELQVGGRHGVPLDAMAAVLNVTATGATGWGYVTVWPCGDDKPVASNLNYVAAGQTRPNAVVSKLGTGGKVCLATGEATADLIADVDGYFPKPEVPNPPPPPPPATTTTTTQPPITIPGQTTLPPVTLPPDAPGACAIYLNQAVAQTAYNTFMSQVAFWNAVPIIGPAIAATYLQSAQALDTNGNGIACEDYPFLV